MYLSYIQSPLIKRFEFIKRLGADMIEPHLRRLNTQTLPRSPKTLVKKVFMFDEDQEDQPERVPSDKLDKR